MSVVPGGLPRTPGVSSTPAGPFPRFREYAAAAARASPRSRWSCEGILQQKIERLVEIDMGNAVAVCAVDPRRLEHWKLGKALAPETGRRRRHRHDPGEEPDPPLAAFG